MLRRRAIAVLLAVLMPGAAFAQGNGNGGGNNGQGNGNGNGPPDGMPEQSNRPDAPPGQADKPPQGNAPSDAVTITDPGEIRDAVREGRALPLEAISARIKAESPGRLVKLDLVSVHGTLIYDATLIEADGLVRTILFNARSGQLIGPS